MYSLKQNWASLQPVDTDMEIQPGDKTKIRHFIITSLAFWFFFFIYMQYRVTICIFTGNFIGERESFFQLTKSLNPKYMYFLFGQQNISTGTYFWWEKENLNILLGTFKSPHGPAEFLPGAQILWWSAPA